MQQDASDPKMLREPRLPRRDWILLPLLCLLTTGLLAASTELIARLLFSEFATREDGCILKTDQSQGWRGIPNCVVREKTAEGELVEHRFNSSGYRSSVEFGPKQPNTYRIVVVGSSIAMGGEVKMEEGFAALLAGELSQRTGRKVEVYNEAIAGWGGTPRNIASRFKSALSQQPDMVLWALTAWDIRNASGVWPTDEILPDEKRATPNTGTPGVSKPGASRRRRGLLLRLRFIVPLTRRVVYDFWHSSRTNLMLTHYIDEYGSRSDYLDRCGIWHNDGQYLGAEPGIARLHHLEDFDGYAATIEAQASAAHVPLVAVLVPIRCHVALISMGNWPANIDPFSLDNEVRTIIVSHGGTYIDVLPDYRGIRNAEMGYFPVDGHLNPLGNSTLSELLAKELTSGAVPDLKVDTQFQSPGGQGP